MKPDPSERVAALLWQMFHPLAGEIPWADVTGHPAGNDWRERAREVLNVASPDFDSAVDLLREVVLGHPDTPNIESFLEINDPTWP